VAQDFTRFTIRTDDDSLKELVKLLKQYPDRLDKEMRARFRELAKRIRDIARQEAQAARPTALTPKHKGDYHWGQLVNSITSGADVDAPWVQYGRDNIAGWAGWEFGSDKWPQFPPRSAQWVNGGNDGYFFYPTVRRESEHLDVEILEIAYDIARQMFGDSALDVDKPIAA
jgi:hypothetical protein